MPHQDGRDVVANQPIPRRAGAPASGRHDQSSSWTVKTSAASGHDGTAVRLGGEIHGGALQGPFRDVALLSAPDPVAGPAGLLPDPPEGLPPPYMRSAAEHRAISGAGHRHVLRM